MLTQKEQRLCLLLLPRDRKAEELDGIFYNVQSLYRSARRLRDFGLLRYNAGLFSLTFKGIVLAHIVDDAVKSRQGGPVMKSAMRKQVKEAPLYVA
jgi:predicted transcriptional regulator